MKTSARLSPAEGASSMKTRYFGLGGRPPLRPLSRAASAFASLRALPPFRPNATAAGFLRGIAATAATRKDLPPVVSIRVEARQVTRTPWQALELEAVGEVQEARSQ
jgi:hypothetical protein